MNDYSEHLKLINNCDQSDPMLSSTKLGQQLSRIPLETVDTKNLIKLYKALNLEQIIKTSNGLARDYRGMAKLMGFTTVEIKTHFEKSFNPMKSVIETYMNKRPSSSRGCEKKFSLNDLIKMIEQIERFDVVDDLIPILIRIATKFDLNIETPEMLIGDSCQDITNLVDQVERLTLPDTLSRSRYYDAFVCYAIQDDHYANGIITHLEECNKTVTTANEILSDDIQHENLRKLIGQHCHSMIIVITPNFLRSKECELQTKIASDAIMKEGCPKLIPVLFESCDENKLPPLLRVISNIDLTSDQSRTSQMKKLLGALAKTPESFRTVR